MPDSVRSPFAYAIVQVVPRIERGERFNAGVVLYCRQRQFLAAKIDLDETKLATLAPDLDPKSVREYLDAFARIAAGDESAGPIAALPQSERFGWLAAPSSTIIQPSPTHTGLSEDPAHTLECLFRDLVD